MKIKMNKGMELILDNDNGQGLAILSLADTDGEILMATEINVSELNRYLISKFMGNCNEKCKKLAEIRSLVPGDQIFVCGITATFESYEEIEEGDCTLWFTDDGLYKGEDGEYYDIETKEKVEEYIGNCSLIEYEGKYKIK